MTKLIILLLMIVFPYTSNAQTSNSAEDYTRPSITSFVPASGIIGTEVKIIGTNFSTVPHENIVYFGAVKASVTSASSTQLIVTVPAGATYQPITVTANRLTGYSDKPFIVTFPCHEPINTNSFSAQVNFPSAQSEAYFSAIGDIDGDGKVDLVTANYSGTTISVFKNTSTTGEITESSFAPQVDFVSGAAPSGIALGDVDGDGKLDLAVTNQNSNSVSVFKNNSIMGVIDHNSFVIKANLQTSTKPAGVAISDLDGDGKAEIVAANNGQNFRNPSRTVSVFKNNISTESQDFAFDPKQDFITGLHPLGVSIADLDGDGKPEIVVASGSDSVSVLKNITSPGVITDESFASKVDFEAGHGSTNKVAIGDIDGDGKPDLAVVNLHDGNVSVLRNITTPGTIGETSFEARVNFNTGIRPLSVAMNDLDGDAKIDLAVVHERPVSVSVFRNTATLGEITENSFASKIDFPKEQWSYEVVIGDIDGDGKPDLVVGNDGNSIAVLRNTTPTLNDNTAPVISTCAPAATIVVNHTECTAVLPDYRSLVSASDTSGPTTLTQTPVFGTLLPIGDNTIIIEAMDDCGNSSSCSIIVTVIQTIDATFTANKNRLNYGYASDQTSTIQVKPTGGTAPFTVTISMNRPLSCNFTNSNGDEQWVNGSGTIYYNNISCPTSGSLTGPPSATSNVSSGDFYQITLTLMKDAILYALIIDANGCSVTKELHIDAEDVRCFAGNSNIQKVALCHITGSLKNPCVTICVNESAVSEHLAHGDFIGNCGNSCTAPSANARTKTDKGEVLEINEESSMEVYPNPIKTSLSIKLANPSNKNVFMNMLDATGKSVIMKRTDPAPNGIYVLDTEQLQTGLYLLQVKFGPYTKTIKLMKE